MSVAKSLFLWFASGLCVATGSKLGEFLAKGLISCRQPQTDSLPGTAALELCPQCGKGLRRFAKALFCVQCGYREG